MRHLMLVVVSGVTIACLGCESASPPQLADRTSTGPQPPEPEPPPPEKTAEELAVEAAGGKTILEGKKAALEGARAALAARKARDAREAAAEEGEMKKAEVGVGAKGKNYGGPGFVTTPVEAYFTAQERISFEIQIPNAMKLYKAAHNNKGPKTHEEFMEVIIRENAVPLPELKPGEEYWYDAESEQLMVRAPKTDE